MLLAKEKGAVVFRRLTDELIPALGVKVSRQRLDSTHILSSFARLNWLGLFCETIRVFLHALKKGQPAGLLKRHGEESWSRDARREDGPRRLGVVALWVEMLLRRVAHDTGEGTGTVVTRSSPDPSPGVAPTGARRRR